MATPASASKGRSPERDRPRKARRPSPWRRRRAPGCVASSPAAAAVRRQTSVRSRRSPSAAPSRAVGAARDPATRALRCARGQVPALRDVPQWLRRTRWQAFDLAWRGQWRAVRAAAGPWVKQELAAARDKLRGAVRPGVVVDRDALDRWLRAAAPPGVPFDAVVLRGDELAARFPDGPAERRS